MKYIPEFCENCGKKLRKEYWVVPIECSSEMVEEPKPFCTKKCAKEEFLKVAKSIFEQQLEKTEGELDV